MTPLRRKTNPVGSMALKATLGRRYALELKALWFAFNNLVPQSEALRLAAEVGKREQHITVLFNNAGSLLSSYMHVYR